MLSAGAVIGAEGCIFLVVFPGIDVFKQGLGLFLETGLRTIIRGDFGGTAGGVPGLFTSWVMEEGSGTSGGFSSDVAIKTARSSGSTEEDARFVHFDLELSSSSRADGSSLFSAVSGFFSFGSDFGSGFCSAGSCVFPNVFGWRIIGSCTGFRTVLSKKFWPHDAPGALLDLSWTGNLPGMVAVTVFSTDIHTRRECVGDVATYESPWDLPVQ